MFVTFLSFVSIFCLIENALYNCGRVMEKQCQRYVAGKVGVWGLNRDLHLLLHLIFE